MLLQVWAIARNPALYTTDCKARGENSPTRRQTIKQKNYRKEKYGIELKQHLTNIFKDGNNKIRILMVQVYHMPRKLFSLCSKIQMTDGLTKQRDILMVHSLTSKCLSKADLDLEGFMTTRWKLDIISPYQILGKIVIKTRKNPSMSEHRSIPLLNLHPHTRSYYLH